MKGELTKTQQAFIGCVFPTPKGGALTVIAVLYKKPKVVYEFSCSICSLDLELWGSTKITSTKDNIIQGSIPCGCTTRKWNLQQKDTLVKRSCEENNLTFLGYVGGELVDSNTKVIFEDTFTGIYDDTVKVLYLLQGHTGRKLGGLKIKNHHTLSGSDVLTRLKDIIDIPEGVIIERDNNPRIVKYICPVCTQDDLPTNVFTTSINSLSKGVIPCRCNKSYVNNYKDKQHLAEKYVNVLSGYILNKETLKDNDFHKTRVLWLCKYGHKNDSSLSNLRGGSSCTSCRPKGFNKNRPAYFYIVRWYGFGESFLKYGITTRKVITRVKEQSSLSCLDYEILYEYYNPCGILVSNLEKEIKRLYKSQGVCPKRWLPSGYTETVEDTHKNLDLLKSKGSLLLDATQDPTLFKDVS